MCRFTASLAPPPAPEARDGLEALLDGAEDDFNWFDAIDVELNDVELGPAAVQPACAAEAGSPSAQTDATEQSKSGGSAGSCGTSSYDLVELFKQQVQQQAPPVAQFPQFVAGPPFSGSCMPPQQQLALCGVVPGGPYTVAPQLLAPAAFLPAAAGPAAVLNNALCATPAAAVVPMGSALLEQPAAPTAATAAAPCGSGSATAPSAPSSTCGSRGRRSQKTQEEIDAAVERIKQKRRESAQRSRARKNDYMHQLELENQALKEEVQRLQQVLAAVQRSTFQPAALVHLGAM